MIGIGPITTTSAASRMDSRTNYETAKIEVLKDFLAKNLGYIKEELDKISVV